MLSAEVSTTAPVLQAGQLYGQGTVEVIADATVQLRIKLTKDPPPGT